MLNQTKAAKILNLKNISKRILSLGCIVTLTLKLENSNKRGNLKMDNKLDYGNNLIKTEIKFITSLAEKELEHFAMTGRQVLLLEEEHALGTAAWQNGFTKV